MADLNIKDIQIMALAAVEDPDWPAQYREICRWYSREFSTPLHQVEKDLDYMHVLQHYYEYTFKSLSTSSDEESRARYTQIIDLIIQSAKSKEEVEEEEAEADDWAAEMNRQITENEKQIKAVEKKKADQVETLENPNIEDEIEFSVQGEDTPPEY